MSAASALQAHLGRLNEAVEELYQPERICSLGLTSNIYYRTLRLEVGVEVPEVVRAVEWVLNRERRVICYSDDYARWCESMGRIIGCSANESRLGHGSEIWTRFEGDVAWSQSVIWQDQDLGRAALQSLVHEGALFERTHTELRTGVFTRRYYVDQRGLDAWTAARLLALEENHG